MAAAATTGHDSWICWNVAIGGANGLVNDRLMKTMEHLIQNNWMLEVLPTVKTNLQPWHSVGEGHVGFCTRLFFNFSTCTYSSYYTLAFFRSPFLSGVHQTTRLSWVIIDVHPTVATAVHAWDGNALRAHPNSLGLSWMQQTEQTFIMTLGVLELRRFGSLKPLQSNSIPFNPRNLDQL